MCGDKEKEFLSLHHKDFVNFSSLFLMSPVMSCVQQDKTEVQVALFL